MTTFIRNNWDKVISILLGFATTIATIAFFQGQLSGRIDNTERNIVRIENDIQKFELIQDSVQTTEKNVAVMANDIKWMKDRMQREHR